MTTVLVTGCAGLLGGRFCAWLLGHVPDVRILGIDDLSCGYRENIPPAVHWYPVELGAGRDAELLHRAFAESPDYVFHFAAYAAEGLSPFIRTYNYRNNLLATAEILNCCLSSPSVRRLVYTSSMATYGRGAPPFDEAAPLSPIDPYGVAKAACEADIRIAGEQHGLDWTIIRPHNVYGPGQSIWQKYRNVLGNWMARHLAGEPLLIYGDGSQRRAFSYIDDCLPCLWTAATSPAASRQTINLGGEHPVSICDVATTLAEIMGGTDIRHAKPRHEVRDAWCTVQRSIDLLGYQERTCLPCGLASMWSWAQDAWCRYPERRGSHERIEIEVRRGLYPYWR